MKKRLAIIIGILLALSLMSVGAYAAIDGLAQKPEIVELKSAEEVNEFCSRSETESNLLSDSNYDDVMSTITFSRGITAEELQSYIGTHNLEPIKVVGRIIESDGTRGTFASWFDEGISVRDIVNYAQTSTDANGGKIVGFTGLSVLSASENLSTMMKDNLTLCLDTSADNAYRTSTNGKLGIKPNSKFFPMDIFWQAEDYGLVSTEGYSALLDKRSSAVPTTQPNRSDSAVTSTSAAE